MPRSIHAVWRSSAAVRSAKSRASSNHRSVRSSSRARSSCALATMWSRLGPSITSSAYAPRSPHPQTGTAWAPSSESKAARCAALGTESRSKDVCGRAGAATSAIVDHQRLRRAAVDRLADPLVELFGGIVVHDPRDTGLVDAEHLGRDALAHTVAAA